MQFPSWLRRPSSNSSPIPRKRRQPAARRLTVESLEDRCLLSFSPAVSYPAGSNPQALAAGDFNNDSFLDLAVANLSSSDVSILLGNGDGTFQPALVPAPATGSGPLSLAVGDFDADGMLDIATASSADVSVLQGNGDGTFEGPTNIDIGSSPDSVAVGDFNADGTLDLGVTSNVYYPGYYYYGGGGYGGYYGYGGGWGGWSWYPGYYSSSANVLLGNGDGSFSGPNTTWLGNGYHTSAAVADFNGDLIQDFATANRDYGTVSVLRGDVSGNLVPLADFSAGTTPSSVAAGDVDGDDDIDLVTANTYGNGVSVLLGDGAGVFGAAQSYTAGGLPTSVVLGDFNADSSLDIATANYGSNTVSVLLGRGNGTFSPPLNHAGALPLAVAAGDFNGDGWLDAATANSVGNNVSVLINDHNWPPAGAPSVSIDNVTVTEGNTGSMNATFTVTLSAAYDQPVTVHYATADGAATAGSDYTAGAGDVTVAAGLTSQTFTVRVLGDRLAEPSEDFVVNLSAATNAIIVDSQGVATIVDDEPRISINDVSQAEGKAGKKTLFTFTVTLSAAYDQAVTMSFRTVNDTATAGSGDYVARTGTLTFNPGETTKTITIEVKGDRKMEADETFYLDLFGNSGNSLFSKNRGIGTILNDDFGGSTGSTRISSARAVDAAIEDFMRGRPKKRGR